jgi:hypothetical protein
MRNESFQKSCGGRALNQTVGNRNFLADMPAGLASVHGANRKERRKKGSK